MVRGENTLLLLDAGTGISNISAFERVVAEYDVVNVFLSHFHLDHTIGICYFSRWFKDKHIVFHVPPSPQTLRSARDVLKDLLNPESFSLNLDQIAANVSFEEYSEFTPFNVGEFVLEAKSQIHSSPCYAVKIDNTLCFATDTIADRTTFEWAKDVRAMLHECWSEQKDNTPHTSFEELVVLANVLKGGSIYLIHQNPEVSRREYEQFCEKHPTIFTTSDLMEFVLE
jgi:ribonuclease BN (tRNA processing enzyme)